MIRISPEAAKMLRERLVRSCFEAGIGFRMFATRDEHGEIALMMKLDRTGPGDEVLESDGVRVFVDPISAACVDDHELNYIHGPQHRFVLR